MSDKVKDPVASARKAQWWADVKAGLIAPPKKRARNGLAFKTKKPVKFGLNPPRRILFRVVDDTIHMREERMRADKEVSISLPELYQLVIRNEFLMKMRKRKAAE